MPNAGFRIRMSLLTSAATKAIMPTKIDFKLTPQRLVPQIERLFELSAQKILSIEKTWRPEHGTPVFIGKVKYTTTGWTGWTQGAQLGSALLQYGAHGAER